MHFSTVPRWDGRTYRGISIIALSTAFVIWWGQAPLNIWTCSSSEKYAFGGIFPSTICLSSLLSLLIMTQTPRFHALSQGKRWTVGSTVITATVGQYLLSCVQPVTELQFHMAVSMNSVYLGKSPAQCVEMAAQVNCTVTEQWKDENIRTNQKWMDISCSL